MTLSIVIVNYNTKELIKKCLNSIVKNYRHITTKPLSLEIIIVDNNSTDGSKEYLKKLKLKFKLKEVESGKLKLKLKVLFNKKNLGFAKANNQGIKIAQGEYILLLNSDTVVLPGSLEKLVKFAQNHPDAGAIAPKLLNPDRTVQPSCYRLPSIGGAVREFWLGQPGAFSKYAPNSSRPVAVDAAVGAALLIPRKVIEKVGLLDERYFMYFEDLDYCRRIWRAGYRVYYLPQAKIIHFHGASGKKLKDKPNQWLVESSKIYHGILKHFLLNLIIRLGQKYKRLIKRHNKC